MTQVTLGSGEQVEVRRLEFLELEDKVDYEVDQPYTYAYETAGGVQEVAYTLQDWDKPPSKPRVPFEKAQAETDLMAEWEAYHLYQAVLLKEKTRSEQRIQFVIACARYILRECVPEDQRQHVKSADDYMDISAEAACPEVGREDIEAELASTFQGYLERQAPSNGTGLG